MTLRLPMIGRQSATLVQCYNAVPPTAIHRPFVRLYLRELSRVAKLANIDRAILTAQSREETTAWSSPVWDTQQNPAGMKNADGSEYITFQSPESAARAHVVQMCAYVYGICPPALLNFRSLAPRFDEAIRLYGGTVKYLDDLGNGKWAEDPNYAANIRQHYELIVNGTATPAVTWIDGCPNQSVRTYGSFPQAIVYHITNDDNFQGTKEWFLTPGSDASSQYVIDRDGRIYQFVTIQAQSWTNNDVRFPRHDIPNLNRMLQWASRGLPYSVNDWTVSIEHVCRSGEPLTEVQYQSSIAITKKIIRETGIKPSRGTMLRHSDINGCSPTNGGCDMDTGRWYCPGDLFDLRRIILAVGGDPADMGV